MANLSLRAKQEAKDVANGACIWHSRRYTDDDPSALKLCLGMPQRHDGKWEHIPYMRSMGYCNAIHCKASYRPNSVPCFPLSRIYLGGARMFSTGEMRTRRGDGVAVD